MTPENENQPIHPKLDSKTVDFDVLIERLQSLQPLICLQVGTCTNIGNGAGFICEVKAGRMDRRCFVHGNDLECPQGKTKQEQKKILKKIRKQLDSPVK
jgi:hypothetical protein